MQRCLMILLWNRQKTRYFSESTLLTQQIIYHFEVILKQNVKIKRNNFGKTAHYSFARTA